MAAAGTEKSTDDVDTANVTQRDLDMGGDEPTRIVVRGDDPEKETTIMPGRDDVDAKVIGIASNEVSIPSGHEGTGGGSSDSDDDGHTLFVPLGAESSDPGSELGPLVGWLVVLKGPGRGQGRPIYYGQNSVGRGEEQRIALDFGDQRISRDAHAFVLYDEGQRKFFVRDNGKSNIVRHNGEPVMMPKEIADRDTIQIGDTTVMFVALCGPDFDWLADDGQE
ncbi:MAG: FHA domain-containing protein [Pseudomonadota bacterium]